MCGRYALTTAPEVIAALLHLASIGDAIKKSRYNIAPTQDIPVVRAGSDGKREMVGMEWGLIPRWAKDRSGAAKMINARSETAAEKPAFRDAFKKRRCVIPASGFYEWKKMGAAKQPYFIHRKNDEPLLFAGLWESWTNKESGEEVESCTILTTEANGILKPLHDRMPVVLDLSEVDRWLDPAMNDKPELQSLMKPAPDEWFVMHPVSRRVNTPKIDEASLIEPAAEEPGEEQPNVKGSRKRDEKPDAGLFG